MTATAPPVAKTDMPKPRRKDLIDAVCYGYQHLALTEESAMDAFLSGKARA